jgi:two-component system sensor histidine kinase YesM
MILQPIAENAVCHNLDDFGNLWVTVRDMGSYAHIVIKDDGCGFDPQGHAFRDPPQKGGEREVSRGIGLRYVWLSLTAFYQGHASMEMDSAVGKGTTVTLELPYVNEKSEKDAR